MQSGIGVGEGVAVGEGVIVGVGVLDGVIVGEGVSVGVGVKVAVGVALLVAVGVAVAVAVAVFVAVGSDVASIVAVCDAATAIPIGDCAGYFGVAHAVKQRSEPKRYSQRMSRIMGESAESFHLLPQPLLSLHRLFSV